MTEHVQHITVQYSIVQYSAHSRGYFGRKGINPPFLAQIDLSITHEAMPINALRAGRIARVGPVVGCPSFVDITRYISTGQQISILGLPTVRHTILTWT